MTLLGRGKVGATGYRANGATQSGPPPGWATQLMEALDNAERGYQPEKAMQVVQVMEHLPAVQARIAQFYTRLGQRSVEMVELPPSTADFFAQLGAQQTRQQSALAEAMAACKRAVQDRINRIVGQRQQDAAWDVEKHRGGW